MTQKISSAKNRCSEFLLNAAHIWMLSLLISFQFFQHIVFALTGVMSYVIPDIPSAVKTQMQRERLLAKEARYERGLKPTNNDDELLAAIRDQNQSRLDDILRRGSWGRRLSKQSDSLEAHVDVASKNRKMSNSTVWEVTWGLLSWKNDKVKTTCAKEESGKKNSFKKCG